MIPLTEQQRDQLAATADGFKPVLLRQWKARGLNVSEYEGLLTRKSKVRPSSVETKDPVGVGDFLKIHLAWTGIPSCQRCNALMGELNTAGPAAVRENVAYWSGRLVENLKAIAGAEAAEVGWWTKVKAKGAMVLLGEERAEGYAAAYILRACQASEDVSDNSLTEERPSRPAPSGSQTPVPASAGTDGPAPAVPG